MRRRIGWSIGVRLAALFAVTMTLSVGAFAGLTCFLIAHRINRDALLLVEAQAHGVAQSINS